MIALPRWLQYQGDCITKVTVKRGLTAQAVVGVKGWERDEWPGEAVGMESR